MEKRGRLEQPPSLSMNEFLPAQRDSVGAVTLRDSGGGKFSTLPMEFAESSPEPPMSIGNGLDAFRDARSIIRLLQCSVCSKPFDRPAALPCGNSLCSSCIPKAHERQNISYPNTPCRLLGFMCPFEDCDKEHALGDFATDFALKKSMDVWNTELYRLQSTDVTITAIIKEAWEGSSPSQRSNSPTASVLRGGRLAATYSLASEGRLSVNAEIEYSSASTEDVSCLDTAMLNQIKEKLRPELQCLVCYSMYLNPVTTGCGHTFCRGCLERVLDHSPMCPVCRKLQNITTTFLHLTPCNRRLTGLLTGLFPDDLAQRALLSCLEEKVGGPDGELSTPLFMCTLSYPAMPTFLHIFEPRYRLMVRRAWQGDKRFGMVIPNRTGQPQGDLGITPFQEFGTLLEIKTYQLLPDGRSWIETVGIARFRVKRYGYRDAYVVADVENVEDVPIPEEEHLEARETSPTQPLGVQAPIWTLQSTHQLFQIGKNFINKMRIQSAPFLSQQAINVYGHPPDDPAVFPYWLAIVLPIAEEEGYRLLSCTSVRERLKIVVGWIKKIEDQQRYQPSSSSCAVI